MEDKKENINSCEAEENTQVSTLNEGENGGDCCGEECHCAHKNDGKSAKGGILSDLSEKRDAKAEEKKRRKKLAKKICLPIVGVLVFIFVLNILILPATGSHARVGAVNEYNGGNQYITLGGENIMLSAHRAGGGLQPEETMAAFKLCMEAKYVDIVEFDLHLTSDGELVLMHDHEVDRTSD